MNALRSRSRMNDILLMAVPPFLLLLVWFAVPHLLVSTTSNPDLAET